MKILLFGVDGQLGTALRRDLQSLGKMNAPRQVEIDLSMADDLRAYCLGARPDIIVNAAAYTAVDRAEAEEQTAMQVNALAPAIMAEAARKLGALFVHYSTDYVFDGTAQSPYPEGAPTAPLNAYGRTKLAGEEAVRKSGASHLVLRTAWLYSNHGHNFLNTMLRLGAERRPLRVVNDQMGAPTYADLVADATRRIISRLGTDRSIQASLSGTYHVTCGGSTTWYEFARQIFDLAGMGDQVILEPIAASEYPAPARRPAYSVLSCEKLARVFGVHLPPWQDALRRCFMDRASAVS